MIIKHAEVTFGAAPKHLRDLVDVTDPQRKAELKTALGRALNCWERPPKWLVSLYYEIQLEKINAKEPGTKLSGLDVEQGEVRRAAVHHPPD